MTGSSLTETEVLLEQGVDNEAAHSVTSDSHQVAPQDEKRTLSFAELKAMIESGDTSNIPNNRKIPDLLNVGYRHAVWTASVSYVSLPGCSPKRVQSAS